MKINLWIFATIGLLLCLAYTSIQLVRERMEMAKLVGYMEFRRTHERPRPLYKRIKSDQTITGRQ